MLLSGIFLRGFLALMERLQVTSIKVRMWWWFQSPSHNSTRKISKIHKINDYGGATKTYDIFSEPCLLVILSKNAIATVRLRHDKLVHSFNATHRQRTNLTKQGKLFDQHKPTNGMAMVLMLLVTRERWRWRWNVRVFIIGGAIAFGALLVKWLLLLFWFFGHG